MAQKKTAAAKTAQKKVESTARRAAPLLVATETTKAAKRAPTETTKVAEKAATGTTKVAAGAATDALKVAEKATSDTLRVAEKAASDTLRVAEKATSDTLRVAEKATAKLTSAVPPRAAAGAARKDFGTLATVGQENLEACVQCGTIVAKNVEVLGSEVMSFAQASIEADLAAAKNVMAAKTLREAIDLQTDFARARLERMTSETAKLSELSMRLASQAMEPLRSRLDATAWTVFRPFGQ